MLDQGQIRRHSCEPHENGAEGDVAAVATIVLADDHAVVRSALRRVLEAEDDLEVVAEAGDVPTALHKVLGYKPTVLVLDLNMPGGSSLNAIPRFLEASSGTAIVILTMQDEPPLARAALRAGACAFVLKEAADTELADAVHAVVAGGRYLDPRVGALIVTEPELAAGGRDELSDRQREVLRLLALGYTNPEIAHELCLSVRTIEVHRSQIQRKVRHRSRAELVAYAREHDLFG